MDCREDRKSVEASNTPCDNKKPFHLLSLPPLDACRRKGKLGRGVIATTEAIRRNARGPQPECYVIHLSPIDLSSLFHISHSFISPFPSLLSPFHALHARSARYGIRPIHELRVLRAILTPPTACSRCTVLGTAGIRALAVAFRIACRLCASASSLRALPRLLALVALELDAHGLASLVCPARARRPLVDRVFRVTLDQFGRRLPAALVAAVLLVALSSVSAICA